MLPLSRIRRAPLLMSFTALSSLIGPLGCGQVLGIEPGSLVDAGPTPEAGTVLPDATAPDASTPDAATPDATPEASTPDATAEASTPDAAPDADAQDAADAQPPVASDFTFDLSPSPLSVIRGQSADVTVTITPGPGDGLYPVAVSVNGLPTAVTTSPLTIPAGSTQGTLTLTAQANANLTIDGALTVTAASPTFKHDKPLGLIVRDPSGALDLTFGVGGIANVALAGAHANAAIAQRGLVVQPDGKILFAGNTLVGNGFDYEMVLGRLSDVGVLDPNFGTGGLVAMNEPNHVVDAPAAMRLLPSGKVVLGGFTLVPNDPNSPHAFLAAQFDDHGKLDGSFGIGGFVSEDVGSVDSKGYDLAVLPDGKLEMGGFSGSDFAFVRLTSGGGLDTSFGPSGDGTMVNITAGSGTVTTLAPLADGSVLAGIGSTSFLVTHVTTAGTVDLSYGTQGYATIAAAAPLTGITDSLLVAHGYALFVGATSAAGSTPGSVQIIRLDANGKLDSVFGKNGYVTTVIPGGNTTTGPLAATSDGGFFAGALLPTSTPIGVIR
ncbi:MAG TPA: hypothetical protein VGI39_24160, partial [Polyangiaceae bacterium]